MPAEDGFEGPNDLMLRAVEGQRGNRRPAAGGQAHDRAADLSEVMIPLLVARVKQPHREAGGGIARRLPRAFAQRTVNAGQRQVGEHGGTAGRHGDHMIHMKRGRLSAVRQSAVFRNGSRPAPSCAAGDWREQPLAL